MIKLNKDNLIKLLVIVVVLAFVFEGISLYSGYNSSPQGGGEEETAKTYVGSIKTTLTLESYEPALTVVGNGSMAEIEAICEGLKKDGLAAYYVKPKENMIIINLKRGSDVAAAAQKFEGMNASFFARGSFGMGALVNVSVENVGNVETIGRAIKEEVVPLFETGEEVMGQFDAQITGIAGKPFSIDGVGRISFVPKIVSKVEAKVNVAKVVSKAYEFGIEWEKRNANIEELKAEFPSLEYVPLSYIVPKEAITQERQAEIWGKNLSYVSAVSADSVSVAQNFVDRAQIEADLADYAVSFPSSKLRVSVGEGANVSSSEIENKVGGIFGGNYSAKVYSLLSLEFPDTLSHEGKNYTLKSTTGTAYFEGEYSAGEEIDVSLEMRALGGVVSSVDYVKKR